MIHKWEGYHNGRGSPWGVRGLSPMSGSPVWRTCTRKTNLHNAWLWKPVGLISRRARRLWGTETPLLKILCTNSLTQHPAQRQQLEKCLGFIKEGDSLINFRVCARGAGIWWHFLRGWNHWQVPFLSLSINLANGVHPLLQCSPEHQHCPSHPPQLSPPKQPLPCPTQQATPSDTSATPKWVLLWDAAPHTSVSTEVVTWPHSQPGQRTALPTSVPTAVLANQNSKKEKRIQKNEDSLRDHWDNIKRTSIHTIGTPEGEERDRNRKIIWRNNGWKLS